jgi:hypothetical protein
MIIPSQVTYILSSERGELEMPIYTSGPINNSGPTAVFVIVKYLNNSTTTYDVIRFEAKLLRSTGNETFVLQQFTLAPNSSALSFFIVDFANIYEVIITTNLTTTLVSHWGKTFDQTILPTHRIVHKEMTELFV